MEFHLPALTRYLAETGVASPCASPDQPRPQHEPGSPRDISPSRPSDVTRLLSEQLSSTSAPARIPKAVEAYFVGPAARGYLPIDADAQYIVPFNKPPPPYSPPGTPPEADPNGDHLARPVGPHSPPLACGPPHHSSLQTGQVASVIAAAVNTTPLDWSFLFGSPPPAPSQRTRGRSSSLSAPLATVIRPAKLGSNSSIGDVAAAPPAAADKGGAGGSGPSSLARKGVTMGQMRRQANSTEAAAGGLLARRTNPSVAAMPQTAETKFCSAVMSVMERLAATQSIQTGRYRSLRLQAAEHREAIISTVAMPPPPKTGAFSSKAAANRMSDVLERSGASADDMQAIVRQIQQFKGLSDDLRTAVAKQFQLFSYPPGSFLYEQDCHCDEAFVLISGTVMLHAEGRPPHRLQAGTVLGVELMLRRQAVPLTVTTDPHFEAQLAVLSWSSYESTVRRWAAEKVSALLPELQASQVARLQSGLMRGISYAQRQPGEALYVGGQPTEQLVLLVQGQVLLAAPLEPTTLVTQAQMVSQLRVMIGPAAAAMVLNEMPRAQLPTRGGLRGGLKSTLARTSAATSGGSVRLSGDSGEEGGQPHAASRFAVVAGRRRGSGGGATALAAAAAVATAVPAAKDTAAAAADLATGTGDGAAVSSVSRADEVPVDAAHSGVVGNDKDAAAAAAAAAGAAAGEAAAAAAVPSDGSAGVVQQRRSGSLRLSGSRGSRNSRREAIAEEEGEEEGAAAVTAPSEADAETGLPGEEDSQPSVGKSTGGGYEAADEAAYEDAAAAGDVDAAGNGGGEEELEEPSEPSESAAAATSRMSRVSLSFAGASVTTTAGTGVDVGNAADADADATSGGAEASSEAAPADSDDPRVGAVGYRPSFLPLGGAGVVSEPSLLTVVSAFDLATDAFAAGGGVGAAAVWEPLSPVGTLRVHGSSGALGPEPSFAVRGSPAGEEGARGSGGGFAFAEGADDGGASVFPATPGLMRPSVVMATSAPHTTANGQPEKQSAEVAAAPQDEEATGAGEVPSAESGDGGGSGAAAAAADDGGAGGGNPVRLPDPSSPVQADRGAAAAAATRDSADGGSGGESRPMPAAVAPAGSPVPKGGLRIKISGMSGRLQTQHSGSRGGSRGVSPLPSGASTPRSVARADSVSKGASPSAAAASAGAGSRAAASGSRGDEFTSPLRHTTQRISAVAPLEGAASVGASRGSTRPTTQGTPSEAGPGRPRRPSSPMSEAPSIDDRRFESSTVLVHPTLPLSDPSELPVPLGAQDGGQDAAAAASIAAAASNRASGSERSGGRSSSGAGEAAAAANGVSTEELPTPPASSPPPPSPPPEAATAAVKPPLPPKVPAPLPPPPQQQQPKATRVTANATSRGAEDPNPDIDYSVARVGGAALPGSGSVAAKAAGGAASRTADARPGRAVGLQRANIHPKPRGGGGGGTGGGGGGDGRQARESGWSYNGSPGAPGGAVGPAAGGASQPLANALASQCKLHQHRVLAVYGGPVVFCEEALSAAKDADSMRATMPPTAHSAVALQRCEYILIPAPLLRSLLPPEQLPALGEAAVAAQRRLVTASGHVEDSGPVTWPAAADKIRHILSTSTPGHRQPWQVELLASAFSHLPAFSLLTWQVRLRVFQDLEYRKLDPGATLELAKLDITEAPPPPSRPSDTDTRRQRSTTHVELSAAAAAGAAPTAVGGGAAAGLAADPAAGDEGRAVGVAAAGAVGAAAVAPPQPEAVEGEGSAVPAMPRPSDVPSSAPSLSPSRNVSLMGDPPEAFLPETAAEDGCGGGWAGEVGASGSSLAAGGGETPPSSAAAPGSVAPSKPSSGKLPWAARYGSRHRISVAGSAASSTAATLESPRMAAAEAASEAEAAAAAVAAAEVEELAAVASMAQTMGPSTAAAAADPSREPSPGGQSTSPPLGSLCGEAAGAVHPPLPLASSRSSSKAAAGSGATSLAGEEAAVTADAELAVAGGGGGGGDGGGRVPQQSGRPSRPGEAHTVEALFNPAEEEPLIPSLALRQRLGPSEPSPAAAGTDAAEVTPFSAATAAALMASGGPYPPALRPEASAATTGPPASVISPNLRLSDDGDGANRSAGGVEFPVGAELARAESPSMLPRGTSLDREVLSLAGTLDSGPPSVSPYSLNSLPITPYDSSYAGGTEAAAVGPQRASMTAGSGALPAPAATPTRREASVAEKLDDRAYWCLSGSMILEAQLLPSELDSDAPATSTSDPPHHHQPPTPSSVPTSAAASLGPERSGSSVRSNGKNGRSPRSRQLHVANPGDAFSGGALAEAATAAFNTLPHSQPGQRTPQQEQQGQQQQQQQHSTAAETAAATAPPPQLQQQLLQVLPLGCSLLRARVAAEGGGAEVLCMSRTMFELLSRGIGRSVPPAVLPVLARHVDWLMGVDLQSLATDLAGSYRLEEHKQGTELLRAGEAAPVVFLVASGECVLRGPVVGLKEPGSVADQLDLATLREGATCGELSLLAARPLWYTLVVSSAAAKVVSLDMPALRSWLLTSQLGRAAAADVVAAVAEVDITLYGRAVKQIAVQVMSEKLDMSLFNTPMKKILRRVVEDNGPELSASLERQREREREQQLKQQRQEASKGKAAGRDGNPTGGTGAGAVETAASSGASSTSKRPRDIVLEGWNQVEAIAASLARPYDPQAQSWELIAQARYNAARRTHNRYLDSLLIASQLTTQEDAGGHPSGDQRIAMPAPGRLAEAMAEPGPVRNAKLYDIRTVPKALRGSEVESSRLSWDCAYVPLHELTTMMAAQVHIKQAAALQLLLITPHSRIPNQTRTHTQNPHHESQEQQLQLQEGEQPPPGCSAAVGASNCLITHKTGGSAVTAVRLRPGGIKRPGPAATGSIAASSGPSSHRTSATLVPTAPWDAKGRLPGAADGAGGGGDGAGTGLQPSPRRMYRDKPRSPSGWSLAPLETLGGKSTGYLSHAPSTSSMALMDPQLRSQMDLIPSGPDSPRWLVASYDGPAHRALGVILEEPSSSLMLAHSLDLGAGRASLAKAPASMALPALPPPHGGAAAAWPPGLATHGSPAEAAADAGGSAGNTKRGRIQASPTLSGTVDDPTRSFWVRDKLHDPQGLAESVMADGVARAVGRSNAAAGTGSRTRGLLAPQPDDGADATAASSDPGPSANMLMAAGGRTGLPASGRSLRLTPLRRRGSGSRLAGPGPGGAAAASAAAAAAAAAGVTNPGGLAAAGGRRGGSAPAAPAMTSPPPDSEMLYVTLQLPEAPKILPEFPSAAAFREAAEAAAAAEHAAREARLAAAISHYSTRPLCVRPDMKYVPHYLRQRQRLPVVPPPVRPLPEGTSESWVVPSYSSEAGFQDGFYDENSQVIYFD